MAVLTSFSTIYNLPIVDDEVDPDGSCDSCGEPGSTITPDCEWHRPEMDCRRRLKDGGITSIGWGALKVILNTELSTFDFDALTSLVIAAHVYNCRVALGPARRYIYGDDEDDTPAGMELMIHPRCPSEPGVSGMISHPGPDDLIKRIERWSEVVGLKEPVPV